MANFQPLEVVCRGSETQLQVVENLKYLSGKGVKISLWEVITLGGNTHI